jgi:TolB-like protein/Tfp pilus assembly protein PilF
MFVIASNSTFTYKGKPVKVQQVSEELGVRYVLEGSAQKIGNRLRITAQLIDATTGRHLWSEKYDRNMEDLFALQDEITHKIIVELQVKLTEGEQARVSHKSTTNLEAWSYAVRGLKLFERISKENNAKAMELFERAVKLDPGYVWAWVRLAWTHVMAMTPGWGPSPSESFKKTVEISQKVLALDDSDSDVRALLGLVYLIQGRYEEALAEGEKSLALGPTNAQAHVLQAVRMHHVGRFDDGIELVKKAMRLHPYYPAYYLQWLGAAYRMTGRYEDALQIYKQLLDRANKGEFPSLEAHVFLADVYTELDRVEEAQTHAAEVLKLKPGLSLAEISSNISTYTFKDPAHLERRLNALRKSGIPEHPPLRLPDKPSIAVLAFDNLSGDPKQEYFSDGISEEIITALSKTPKLFVIARTSSFKFKGKEVDVRTVGRELGVRYVLEGSIRKAGDKVRITAQLIDAKTNNHIWADRYDRELKDIFAIQDEITLEILKAMQVKLTDGEYARTFARGTNNIDAYLKAYQASALLWHREDTEDIRKARLLAMEAMALDPKYAIPYTTLAWSHMMDVFMQSTESTQESMKLAAAASKKALEIDGSHPQVHKVLSNLYIMQGESDKAIASAKRAVELSPGDSLSFANLGLCLMFACKPIEAIPMYEKALRRNPFSDFTHHRNLAWVYLMVGRYDDAIEELQKAVQKNPSNYHIYYNLVLAYTKLGRNEKARAAAAKLLEIYPKFSLDWWAKTAVKMYAKECQSAIHNDIEFLRKSDVGLK